MNPLHATLVAGSADLIQKMLVHPFVVEIADGTLSDERFMRWLAQDYLWIRDFEQFLAILGARAPLEVRRPFFEALINLHGEIELFEEIAARNDVDIRGARMCFACNAYANFLHATVGMKSFAEALSACYGSEYAYLAAWGRVKATQKGPSRWQEFIDLWSSDLFAVWVESLGKMIDAISESSPTVPLDRMQDAFRMAIRYEIRFWDMAYDGTDC